MTRRALLPALICAAAPAAKASGLDGAGGVAAALLIVLPGALLGLAPWLALRWWRRSHPGRAGPWQLWAVIAAGLACALIGVRSWGHALQRYLDDDLRQATVYSARNAGLRERACAGDVAALQLELAATTKRLSGAWQVSSIRGIAEECAMRAQALPAVYAVLLQIDAKEHGVSPRDRAPDASAYCHWLAGPHEHQDRRFLDALRSTALPLSCAEGHFAMRVLLSERLDSTERIARLALLRDAGVDLARQRCCMTLMDRAIVLQDTELQHWLTNNGLAARWPRPPQR